MFPFKITVHNDVSIGIVSRGGGLEVSVVARYSDDPSSKPPQVYNFVVKIVVKKTEK